MNKLKMTLDNCYGIKKMKLDIDFTDKNVAVIYAPNGTMKTSLAKTFDKASRNESSEERIFNRSSSYSFLDESNNLIKYENIISMNPFSENEEDSSNQGLLMANDGLRKAYITLHKNIDLISKQLYDEVKLKLGFTSRQSFETKQIMLETFNFNKKDEYECLKEISDNIDNDIDNFSLSDDELNYSLLFNDKVTTAVHSSLINLINQYEEKYKELVSNSTLMKYGVMDHNNYYNISKSLSDNSFFKLKHEINLNAGGDNHIQIKSKKELDDLIETEKNRILNDEGVKNLFNEIDSKMNKNKDLISFNSFIREHTELLVEYADISLFKKKVFVRAFRLCKNQLDNVLKEFEEAKDNISLLRDKAINEKTKWEEALTVFKSRFYVPFDISIGNQEDVILKNDLPTLVYTFSDDSTSATVQKANLLDVLSTGEKRAYYILQMIFKIMNATNTGEEHLLVLDDISESFDYKNKFAIIEYINDISKIADTNGDKRFKLLILTHNFDFYRTVASRLGIAGNSYIAYEDNGEIKFVKGNYTKNVFNFMIKNTNKDDSYIIGLVPFVRNLIEYINGDNDPNYLKLTSLLHIKNDTTQITLIDLQNIFNSILHYNFTFADGREQEKVYDVITGAASRALLLSEKIDIQNKLVLSIAIRLKAENYMIDKIKNNVLNGASIIAGIKRSQTGELTSIYKSNFNDKSNKVLDKVSLITPQNIHLNSFMFEPILDMSLLELQSLYNEVTNLN